MEVTRKPLAKIEGRKRMQASGLTVSWHGTRSLKDWVAYLDDGTDHGRLVLADQMSERAVKSLLARIQTLSREELRAMARPVEMVAQPGGGPRAVGAPGAGDGAPGPELVRPPASSPQLVMAGNGDGHGSDRPRRRQMAATGETGSTAEARRPARPSSREMAGTLRQLRSRIETLETEQEHLRAELALLRGEADGYDAPSIFVTGWFRATLVLVVLAIVVVITVPWLMDVFDGGAREAPPPARTELPAPAGR